MSKPAHGRSTILAVLSLAMRESERGAALLWALVLAVVAVLLFGVLGSRTLNSMFANREIGRNRAARDLADSVVAEFQDTMNREQNRTLLVAGNDETSNWGSTNTKHRNPCTLFSQDANGEWQLPSGVTLAQAAADYQAGTMTAAAATTADAFIPVGANGAWKNFNDDSTKQYRIESVQYRYETGSGISAARVPYNYGTINANLGGGITVRDSALSGGTRTTLVIVVQARTRSAAGDVLSQARISREMEVVPKCCKRSFGGNTYGGLSDDPWGGDTRKCEVTLKTGGDNGIVTGLNGGGPQGSKNRLDIRDESGDLVVNGTCRSGTDGGSDILNPDISTASQTKCDSNQLTLGGGTKIQPAVSLNPQPFSLTMPRPWGGQRTYSSVVAPVLSNGATYATPADQLSYIAQASLTSGGSFIGGYTEVVGGIPKLININNVNSGVPAWARNNLYVLGGGGAVLSSGQLVPLAALACPTYGNGSTLLPGQCYTQSGRTTSSTPFLLNSTGEYELSNDEKIYIDTKGNYPTVIRQNLGSGSKKEMANCVVTQDLSASSNEKQFAIADCYFRNISLDGNDLSIDTTYGKINFYFYGNYSGDYISYGSGNAVIKRLHCDKGSVDPDSCSSEIQWSGGGIDFQKKYTSNQYYNVSELLNFFIDGAGKIVLKGSNAAVGLNLIAPFADVELIGGGNACSTNNPQPNFMGRIWTNNLKVTGDTCMRVVQSTPAFCANAGTGGTLGSENCGTGNGLPLFDVAIKSYVVSEQY